MARETHDSEQDKHRFWALVKRYIQLGQLHPRDLIDFDPEDIDAVTSAQLILDEQAKVKNEIDMLLARNDPRRSAA